MSLGANQEYTGAGGKVATFELGKARHAGTEDALDLESSERRSLESVAGQTRRRRLGSTREFLRAPWVFAAIFFSASGYGDAAG
jgi:hypothetical protein